MATESGNRMIAGVSVISLGLLLWWLQSTEGLGPWAVFFLLGGLFLALYLARKEYGFLIPGCILLGLGAGGVFEDSNLGLGLSTVTGLGAGFLAIYLIPLLYERRSHWWPLIPGVLLILVGLQRGQRIIEWSFENWPVFIVVIGLMIVFGAFGGPRRKRS